MEKVFVIILRRESLKNDEIYGVTKNFEDALKYLKVCEYNLWKENLYQNWEIISEDIEFSEIDAGWYRLYVNQQTRERCWVEILNYSILPNIEKSFGSVNFEIDYVFKGSKNGKN